MLRQVVQRFPQDDSANVVRSVKAWDAPSPFERRVGHVDHWLDTLPAPMIKVSQEQLLRWS